MKNNNKFRPYIPDEQITPELTATSIATGIILAVIFSAANAYLGLRVGMTVSASIPASVMAMGIIRVALRKNSILESNIVQTIGSAGESLAAGSIFTLPALFLWASEGRGERPSILFMTLIALLGGILGVLFMVPLRNALIVKEHATLPYPEGTACAEVLLAGEKKGAGASVIFSGMGFSAIMKFIIDGLKLVSGEISLSIKGYAGQIGTQIYPAVMSVGYICGAKISSYLLAGGILSWLIIIPLLVLGGESTVIYPETVAIGEIFSKGGAVAVWNTYIRYIGGGALAFGGIISLIKSFPLIIKTFTDGVKNIVGRKQASNKRTEKNIAIHVVLLLVFVLTLIIWILPIIPVSFVGAVAVVLFAFFFATVSSKMVGLVGSSNNPISGMAIAGLIITTVVLKSSGHNGISAMTASVTIGTLICIASAVAGDTSQDLKTGYLLGATPIKQQIGEIIGIAAASFAISGTLYLLEGAWGFGSEQLAAPQAMLMKLIVEGVIEESLPWTLVLIGGFIALIAELVGIPVLPFSIGVYLPIQLSGCIMAGGIIKFLSDKINKAPDSNGVLFCSGMIAGEGIVGILLAMTAVFGVDKRMDLAEILQIPKVLSDFGGLLAFLITAFALLKFSLKRKGD